MVTRPHGEPVHLRFMGDWGVANLHAASGWLSAGMRTRTPADSTYVVHTLGSYEEGLCALLDGTVDVAFSTPIAPAAQAMVGRGPFQEAHPELRAIAALPHRDRLVLALPAEVADRHGIATFADFVERRPPLTIVSGMQEPFNAVGFASEQVLRAHGMEWADLEEWGGHWLQSEGPAGATSKVGSGEADGMFHEGIMNWHGVVEKRALRFLPIADDVLERLEEQCYGRAEIVPGDFDGVDEPVATVDFSSWLLVANTDLSDEIAGLLARVVVEDRAMFERRYLHRAPRESALAYPIRAEDVCRTEPVPLHPGAEAYYREIGALG